MWGKNVCVSARVLPVGSYGFSEVDKNQYRHPIQPSAS